GLHLHVDALARGAEQDHARFEADILDGRGEAEPATVGVDDKKPDDDREHERQDLQLPVAREGRQHYGADDDGGSAGRGPARVAPSQPRQETGSPSVGPPSSVRSRRRSASGLASDSIPPSTVSESRPVSSETTTATASVSSVTPSAARWRVPSWRASWLLR